jgi:hypothetical protein
VSRRAKISAGSRESDSARERCLVIGYDRGEAAQRAVQWAVRQLPASGRLVIVFACKGLHIPSLRGERERRRFAGAAIDELLLEADALLDREIATEISERDPVNALSRRPRATAPTRSCSVLSDTRPCGGRSAR